jgi:hypothetical protein
MLIKKKLRRVNKKRREGIHVRGGQEKRRSCGEKRKKGLLVFFT